MSAIPDVRFKNKFLLDMDGRHLEIETVKGLCVCSYNSTQMLSHSLGLLKSAMAKTLEKPSYRMEGANGRATYKCLQTRDQK